MKQHYGLMRLAWLSWFGLFLLSQTVMSQSTPPQLQWQRVVEDASLNAASTVRATQTASGTYGLLAGRSVTLLSATGERRWTTPVPGSYADSTVNRVLMQQAFSIVASSDGGFVVLAQDVNRRYYVTKLDSLGAGTWSRTVGRTDATGRLTSDALTPTADGGYVVVGSYTDQLTYLTLTKLNSEGYIVGQWRIRYTGPTPKSQPLIRRALPLPDQGYLLVGQAVDSTANISQGIAFQLDAQYAVTWQKLYATLTAIQDVVALPGGSYAAVGLSANGVAQAITIAPNQPNDGSVLASLSGVAVTAVVSNREGTIALLDAASSNQGDFRLLNGQLPLQINWTETFGGSGPDRPTALLATDDGGYLAVGITQSTDGTVSGKATNTTAAWVLKLGQRERATTLRLLAPDYDCQTGAIRFRTRGGDGSLITYFAPAVVRSRVTDEAGTVAPASRTDSSVITIEATQSSQTVRYTFALGAFCRAGQSENPPADSLQLVAPTYNCRTGAITFRTIGGDGSSIEYAAEGITGWTTNPNQVVDERYRTATDAPLLRLMARQNGKIVMYVFDLKAACGRARVGAEEPSVLLLGNPVQETASVVIAGAQGQAVYFDLFDARGGLIEQRTVGQAQAAERHTFDVRQQAAGTLLLRTKVNDQVYLLRVLKQ